MELTELYEIADFRDEDGMIFNNDCMKLMETWGGAERC